VHILNGRAWRSEIPTPLTQPRNSERPRVLRLYRRAIDRLTEKESPRVLLHLVSNRQHNSRRLDEQAGSTTRALSDADLTTILLHLHVPLGLPPNFEIKEVPTESAHG
jgi:hypothetical protein